MNISEIIWDINEIKGALEDDSDLEELWLLYKINAYRAISIQQEFALTNQINPQWLQRVPKFLFTKVTSADDPGISISSIMISKAILPKVISLPDDLGVYRVAGSGAVAQLEPCDFNTLMMRIEIEEELNKTYGFYSRIGTNLYAWPLMKEGSAIIIAEDPFTIKIQENGSLRDMTFDDEYPLDIALAQKIVLEFLTKDLNLSDQAVTDIINDSQKQFKIMKDGQSPSKNA